MPIFRESPRSGPCGPLSSISIPSGSPVSRSLPETLTWKRQKIRIPLLCRGSSVWLERLTVDQEVGGSSPPLGTIPTFQEYRDSPGSSWPAQGAQILFWVEVGFNGEVESLSQQGPGIYSFPAETPFGDDSRRSRFFCWTTLFRKTVSNMVCLAPCIRSLLYSGYLSG